MSAPRLPLALVCLLTAFAWDAAAQNADASFDRKVEVAEAARIDVHTGSGAITVRPGNAREVHVIGRLKFQRGFFGSAADEQDVKRRFESDPPIEVAGNEVRVGPRAEDERLYRNVSISFELEVPVDAALQAHTGSGSEDIARIRGSVEATTGSGSIELREVGGPITADTGSGSISLVQSAPGDVTVTTGSGGIDLRGISGALRARSGSGGIDAQGEQKGDWSLETGSGSIHVDLPADAAFDLDARTGSGSIETAHAVTVQGSLERNRLSGKAGAGGDVLRVRTGSGSVRID